MNSKTILLVEDNLNDIELTKRALLRGHITNEVNVAEDGQEALDFMFGKGEFAGRDLTQMPSLILLDLKMPIIDGIEVLRRLRSDEKTRRQVIVILTSSKEEKDLMTCYKLGVNSYIRKPVDFIQFTEILRHTCLYWLQLNVAPPLI
jgi:two-component system, response regulator